MYINAQNDSPDIPGKPGFKPEQERRKTVLYLAYGANLSLDILRRVRGIKPLAWTNVLVPELELTFDLPGFPYVEPCFANTKPRRQDSAFREDSPQTEEMAANESRWHKGLVGVVYEISQSDFARLVATEGGGVSYHAILVDCYSLPDDPYAPVPDPPPATPLKAYTLAAPIISAEEARSGKRGRRARPSPSYARPSTRYLKLLTDGAREHSLPVEYQKYLQGLRSYKLVTNWQRLGQGIFLLLWSPVLLFIFYGPKMFLGREGRYPSWLVGFAEAAIVVIWKCYDMWFKTAFGDGEL